MTTAAEKQADEAITVAMEFAECKLTLDDMVDFAFVELVHLPLGSQRARLLAGLIEQPDADQIERAAKGAYLVRFLETCRDKPEEAIRWLRKRANAKT